MSVSSDGDIYAEYQHHPVHVAILPSLPYLLASVDHELYNSLDSLIFRTHILAGPHWCNGMGKRSWLFRVRKKPIPDSILPLLFPILLELWTRGKAKCHYVCLRVSSCRAEYIPFDRGRSCAACRSGYLPRLGCASSRPTDSTFCLHDSERPRTRRTSSSMICCGADSDRELD